jgi:hypothetical protein
MKINYAAITPRLTGVLIVIFGVFISALTYGQSGLAKRTGQRDVKGIVDPGSGWVQVKIFPGNTNDGTLSYYQKSFVSFSVNGKVYTNNDVGLPSPLPANTFILKDGILTVRPGKKANTDTIRCTWPNKDGIDLIQEIYPVLFEKSEQIVFRWMVHNKTPNPAVVAVQYLLDIQVGDMNYTNDGAPLLTRYGYRPNWDMFTPSTGTGVPWFYIAFQYPLPNGPSFNPGLTGQGYTDNTVANLGLTKPIRQTIGNWPDLIQVRWGPPAPLPGGQYTDCATLLEWNAATAVSNKESFIAATSYGTGEFATCKGQIFGVIFYPLRIKWEPPKLNPDPFIVDFFAFNPQQVTGAPNTKLTLNVGPYLTILGPNPVTNGGKTQTQDVQPGGYIAPLGVGTASWTVKPEKVTNCSTDLYSSLKFLGISPGLGYPIFVNEATGSDTCEHPIIIECANEDLLPPIIDNYVMVDSFNVKVDVHDDRPTTDKGIQSITWTPRLGTDPSKFDISYSPAITPCDKLKHTITIVQKDSTIGGCFDFEFEDCAGNKSDTSICFTAHPRPNTPDLLPPVFTIIEQTGKFDSTSPICNSRLDSILVTDIRQYDRGLLNLSVVSSSNMNLRSLPFMAGTPQHAFAVMVVDSMVDGFITIRACDRDSNCVDTTIRYCTIPDTVKPRVQIMSQGVYRGRWTVQVREDIAWDRRIDTIVVFSPVNVFFPAGAPPTRTDYFDKDYYEFEVRALDTTKPSSFCIEAKDLAANWSTRICVSQGIDSDQKAPNINYAPPANTNPTRITVTVDDIHFDANGDSIVWEKGVDSVWFTNVIGIQTPGPLSYNGCPMIAPTFDLWVIDTLAVTPSACVTIWARDCAGNVAAPETWCYPYKPDTLPPIIVGAHIGRAQIDFVVTDSSLYDRGNDLIELVNEVNFTPPLKLSAGRAPVVPDLLITRNLSTSSKGTLQTTDYWGVQTNTNLNQHTASIDFGIYVQNLAMTKGILLQKSGDFVIPVFLTQTDSFALASKGIREFEFRFNINGDAQSIAFGGAATAATLTNGWNVTATPSGNQITVRGTAPAGQVLSDPAGDYKTPLVILQFTATKDEVIRDITLDIEPINGDYVIYNNGLDTILYGKNAQVTLPAPYGTLSGSHIVIIGTCTPSISADNPNPTIVSLQQNTPNPFTSRTNLRYTVKEDGPVRLAVYDMLGNEMQTLFEGIQKRGTYDITYDGTPFPGGSYIVRLQAGNVVKQKNIMLQK